MTTGIMQVVVAVLTLTFALLASAVARERAGMSHAHRAAWIIVAVFFLWRAVPGLPQSLAMLLGLEAGPGSREFAWAVRWSPAMNYLRTLIAVAMGWALAALPLLRGHGAGRLWRGASLACAVLGIAGVYVGWREGPTSMAHIVALTVLGAVELIGLLAALMVGLLANTLDRYLWIILGLYAVQVAMDIMFYSYSAGFFYPGGWYPPPPVRYAFGVALFAAGCLLARRRLALARRGAQVGDLLELVGEGMAPAPRPRA